MLKTLPRMRLSREEEVFLRHWMYDEVHYQEGQGAAKRLQIEHRIKPTDLARLIAAALPDPSEQEAAGKGPPPAEPASWPWSEDLWAARMREADEILAERMRR